MARLPLNIRHQLAPTSLGCEQRRCPALLLTLMIALGGSVSAETWKPTTAGTAWGTSRGFAQSARPAPAAAVVPFVRSFGQSGGAQMDRLLSLISAAESPRLGYDSVVLSARIRPSKPPSQMTLDEITAWVRATPGQHHAIGRYQIIPATFQRVQRALGLSGSTIYNRRTQDMMGRYLVAEAGYSDFLAGRISRGQFMDQLAKVWAGFPLANGRSAYHYIAGNRATISRANFEAQMAAIFPVRSASK